MPSITPHAVPHGHGTAGLRAGVDLVTMSGRLGHGAPRSRATSSPTWVEGLGQDAAELAAGLLVDRRRGQTELDLSGRKARTGFSGGYVCNLLANALQTDPAGCAGEATEQVNNLSARSSMD